MASPSDKDEPDYDLLQSTNDNDQSDDTSDEQYPPPLFDLVVDSVLSESASKLTPIHNESMPPALTSCALHHAVQWLGHVETIPQQYLKTHPEHVAALISDFWQKSLDCDNLQFAFYFGCCVATLMYRTRMLNRYTDLSKDLYNHLDRLTPLSPKMISNWRRMIVASTSTPAVQSKQSRNALNDQTSLAKNMFCALDEGSSDSSSEPERDDSPDIFNVHAHQLPHVSLFAWLCYEYQDYWNTALPAQDINFLESQLDTLQKKDLWKRPDKDSNHTIVTILDVLAQASDSRAKLTVYSPKALPSLYIDPTRTINMSYDRLYERWHVVRTILNQCVPPTYQHHVQESSPEYESCQIRMRRTRSALDLLYNLLWWYGKDRPHLNQSCRFRTIHILMNIIEKFCQNFESTLKDKMTCKVLGSAMLCMSKALFCSSAHNVKKRNQKFVDRLKPCLAMCLCSMMGFRRVHKMIQIGALLIVRELVNSFSMVSDNDLQSLVVDLESSHIMSALLIHLYLDKFIPFYLTKTRRYIMALLSVPHVLRYATSPFIAERDATKILPPDSVWSCQTGFLPLANMIAYCYPLAPSNTEVCEHILPNLLLTNDNEEGQEKILWSYPKTFAPMIELEWNHALVALLHCGLKPSIIFDILRSVARQSDGCYPIASIKDALLEIVKSSFENGQAQAIFADSFLPIIKTVAKSDKDFFGHWIKMACLYSGLNLDQ